MLDDFDGDQFPRIQNVLIERVLGLGLLAGCQVDFAEGALAKLPDRAPELLRLLGSTAHHYVLSLVIIRHVLFLGVGNTAVACVARGWSGKPGWHLSGDKAPLHGKICLAVHALLHVGVRFYHRDLSGTSVAHCIWSVLADASVALAGCLVPLLRVCSGRFDGGRFQSRVSFLLERGRRREGALGEHGEGVVTRGA